LYPAALAAGGCHPTAPLCATITGMNKRERLTKQLQEAERELDAAKTLTGLNAAAKKLQRGSRAELGWLADEEKPKRPSRGHGSADASS
jgi:hypothetical protein